MKRDIATAAALLAVAVGGCARVPAYKLDALVAHCERRGGVFELYVNPGALDLAVVCANGERIRFDALPPADPEARVERGRAVVA